MQPDPSNIVEIDFFGSSRPRSAAEREKKIASFKPDPTKRPDFLNYGFTYYDDPDYGVGYGGYRYDGRYAGSVDRMISHYQLNPGARVLEMGCAKGFVLYEFHKRGMDVAGIDVSSYAVANAVPEIANTIIQGSCRALPWENTSFDLVYSKETLPHLDRTDLGQAIDEAGRVARDGHVFHEIQIAESAQERELIRAWDETHRTLEDADWWRQALADRGFRGQVNFKRLF